TAAGHRKLNVLQPAYGDDGNEPQMRLLLSGLPVPIPTCSHLPTALNNHCFHLYSYIQVQLISFVSPS
ncbi:hypothetical protein, partial [[Clostridium] symbiosum]|uniref:hypothetical protein n=1 Tax=Clostridium symbiosum TaxID=1512 RepID=UPI001A983154